MHHRSSSRRMRYHHSTHHRSSGPRSSSCPSRLSIHQRHLRHRSQIHARTRRHQSPIRSRHASGPGPGSSSTSYDRRWSLLPLHRRGTRPWHRVRRRTLPLPRSCSWRHGGGSRPAPVVVAVGPPALSQAIRSLIVRRRAGSVVPRRTTARGSSGSAPGWVPDRSWLPPFPRWFGAR